MRLQSRSETQRVTEPILRVPTPHRQAGFPGLNGHGDASTLQVITTPLALVYVFVTAQVGAPMFASAVGTVAASGLALGGAAEPTAGRSDARG